jgi:hypothetical protein
VEHFFLDEGEQAVVVEGLKVLDATASPQAQFIREALERLGRLADLVRSYPAIHRSFRGRKEVSSETLVDLLCRLPDYDLDLHVPTKTVLGQAYLVAKINFFKAIGYALTNIGAPGDLLERVDFEAGQSIYTKLAEELFLSIVTDPQGKQAVKARAARALFDIWENRLSAEIDDFAPVLESVWVARNNMRPVLGTLKGTHELLRMLASTQDHRFLEHFTEEEVPEEEVQAFEEFLFGLSHEEITKLRAHLEAQAAGAVSHEDARGILGRNKESWAPTGGPQELYTSYKKRKVKANYRVLTDTVGPKKTAEEYVMTSFLEREGLESQKIRLQRKD